MGDVDSIAHSFLDFIEIGIVLLSANFNKIYELY